MVQRTLEFALDQCHASLKLLPYCGRGRRTGVCSLEAMMRLLRITALTAVVITAAVPLLTSDAQAWRWRGGGWRAAAVGAAVVGSAIAARSYYGYGYGYPAYGYSYGYGYPAYGYGYGTGYGHPAYGYGYGTGYYGGYGYAYHPVARHIYARAVGV